MKLTDAIAQELYHQMHLYLQQMTELQDTLARERDAIRQRDFDRFATILEHKNHLLKEVSAFDQGIVKILKKILNKPSTLAFDALIDQYHGQQASTIKLQWQAVKRLTGECKRANDVNSKIVSHMQHYYSRLASILRQDDPNASTYAKNGRQATGSSAGGRLAQA